MRRFLGLAVALAALLSAASAALATQATDAKLGKGLQNAKTAVQGKHQRDQKVREVKKQAYAKRQQALATGRQ